VPSQTSRGPKNLGRSYQSDLAHFLAWGGSIPAGAEQVARYLADHAASLSMATLARRVAGIRASHAARGFAYPTDSELVRLTFRGIRRTFGRPQRRVAALTIDQLANIIGSLGRSSKDIRDAAILLIGFAGAFRRSELITIDCQDVHIHETGIAILVRRSKTDQIRQGRIVSIPRVGGRLCPVAALEEWLRVSGIAGGPLFRPVAKSGRAAERRMSAEAVARIVKKRIRAVGSDPNRYSGHSLRAGFATEAARCGVPKWRIKSQTGHLSDSILERYIREPAAYDFAPLRSIFAAGQPQSDLHEIETHESRKAKAPESREGCIVHPDGHTSDAEFHEPILSGISPEREARLREITKKYARRAGLSEEEIKKLYG
jgi:integrase